MNPSEKPVKTRPYRLKKTDPFFSRHRKSIYTTVFFCGLWGVSLSFLEWEDSLRIMWIVAHFLAVFMVGYTLYFLGQSILKAAEPVLSWLFVKDKNEQELNGPEISHEEAKEHLIHLLSCNSLESSYKEILASSSLEKNAFDEILAELVEQNIVLEDLDVDDGIWLYRLSEEYRLNLAQQRIKNDSRSRVRRS